MFGFSINLLKILSLSNTVGGMDPSFIHISLMCSYYDYIFHPIKGGHVVSIFECDYMKSSSEMMNHLEGVLMYLLTKLKYYSVLPPFYLWLADQLMHLELLEKEASKITTGQLGGKKRRLMLWLQQGSYFARRSNTNQLCLQVDTNYDFIDCEACNASIVYPKHLCFALPQMRHPIIENNPFFEINSWILDSHDKYIYVGIAIYPIPFPSSVILWLLHQSYGLSSLLLPPFLNACRGLVIVVQASMYGFLIITLKILSLSNNVGCMEPSFIPLSLMWSY